MTTANTPKLRDLTIDEVGDFLVAKNVSPVCPNCGHDKCQILSETDRKQATTYAIVPAFFKGTPAATLSHNFATLFAVIQCENCGFLRHFSNTAILRWLESRSTDQ